MGNAHLYRFSPYPSGTSGCRHVRAPKCVVNTYQFYLSYPTYNSHRQKTLNISMNPKVEPRGLPSRSEKKSESGMEFCGHNWQRLWELGWEFRGKCPFLRATKTVCDTRLSCTKLCLDQGQTWQSKQAGRAFCIHALSMGPCFLYGVSENWPAGSVMEKLTSLELGWRKCFLFNLLPRQQESCSWGETPGIQITLCISGVTGRGSVSGYVLIHKKMEEGSQSALTVWLDLESTWSQAPPHFCEAFQRLGREEPFWMWAAPSHGLRGLGSQQTNGNKRQAEFQPA